MDGGATSPPTAGETSSGLMSKSRRTPVFTCGPAPAGDDVAQGQPRRHALGQGHHQAPLLSLDQFSELQPLIHKVMEYGKAMGLEMIQGDHEDAPGQLN